MPFLLSYDNVDQFQCNHKTTILATHIDGKLVEDVIEHEIKHAPPHPPPPKYIYIYEEQRVLCVSGQPETM